MIKVWLLQQMVLLQVIANQLKILQMHLGHQITVHKVDIKNI